MRPPPSRPRPLAPTTVRRIFDHFGLFPDAPHLPLLAHLVRAYTRTVPWESASRIARRARIGDATRPRTPAAFWRQAEAHGTGGTCFESNMAFAALLRTLGYYCYFTINDMGASVGVHSAIIVLLDGAKWLVDVGMPLYAPLPLDPAHPTTADGDFHTYTATPKGDDTYAITRDRHPNPYCFTLRDRPIPDAAYGEATSRDYGPDGLFLDRVILLKVVGGRIWRFDSAAAARCIEAFENGERTVHPLPHGATPALADALATHFRVDAATIRAALAAVQ